MVKESSSKTLYFTGSHGLSGSALKMIAVVTMIIDHIGMIFFLGPASTSSTYYAIYYILRLIGRISFPLFAFLVAEGITHTKNIYKYLLRMLIFAIICEIPFDLVIEGSLFDFSSSNIFFTFTFSIAPVAAMRLVGKFAIKSKAEFIKKYAHITAFIVATFACLILAEASGAIYSYYGVALVLVFYIFKNNRPFDLVAAALVLFAFGRLTIELYSLLALPIIFFYNGERGFINTKVKQYIFYAIYPVHLVVLYGISFLVGAA